VCRYFLGNKCDKNRNMRKDVKVDMRKMEAAEINKIPQL
jgi:hypothetical protein